MMVPGDSIFDRMYPRRRSVSTSSNVTFVLGDSGSSGNASADEGDEDRSVDVATQTDETSDKSVPEIQKVVENEIERNSK